jgi:hypothetical protein
MRIRLRLSDPVFERKLKSNVKTLIDVGTGAFSSKAVPDVLN